MSYLGRILENPLKSGKTTDSGAAGATIGTRPLPLALAKTGVFAVLLLPAFEVESR